MQVRAEASHGLFPSKEFFPPKWFGFQIFQQLGLHLLQLQTHTWLQTVELQSKRRWKCRRFGFFPKTKQGQRFTCQYIQIIPMVRFFCPGSALPDEAPVLGMDGAGDGKAVSLLLGSILPSTPQHLHRGRGSLSSVLQ